MSLSLLPLIQGCDMGRYNKAVCGLKDGTLRVTLVTRSEAHIDALVRSRGTVYQTSLTDHSESCTCPDHQQRHSLCKHLLSVVQYCLLHPSQGPNCLHLAHADGSLYCGEVSPARVWYCPGDSVAQWEDQICPACFAARVPPAPLSKDEHFFSEVQTGRAA